MNDTLPTVPDLARQFCRVLRDTLSPVPCGADCPDAVNAIWNAAWDLAKSHNFNPDNL